MFISLEDISLKVGGNTVLSHINVQWEKGKTYGIAGRNGSGKTMLFRVICGLWRPTSGTVTVGGKRIGEDSRFLQDAGIVVGEQTFVPGLSGMDNLWMLAEIQGEIGREEIEESLRAVGLYEEKEKKYRKYSLGMKQKLLLAQALMEKPGILILDEPFNGLDRESVERVQKVLLEKKKEGVTILLASHIAADLELLCDEICEMDQGVLKEA